MKLVLFTLLVLFSLQVFAGGASEEVQLLSLTETTEDEYILKYKRAESGEMFTIYLSYNKLGYLIKARFLIQEKFISAINLLKEQISQKTPVRFGWFGRGLCVVSAHPETYNPLKIIE